MYLFYKTVGRLFTKKTSLQQFNAPSSELPGTMIMTESLSYHQDLWERSRARLAKFKKIKDDLAYSVSKMFSNISHLTRLNEEGEDLVLASEELEQASADLFKASLPWYKRWCFCCFRRRRRIRTI